MAREGAWPEEGLVSRLPNPRCPLEGDSAWWGKDTRTWGEGGMGAEVLLLVLQLWA